MKGEGSQIDPHLPWKKLLIANLLLNLLLIWAEAQGVSV